MGIYDIIILTVAAGIIGLLLKTAAPFVKKAYYGDSERGLALGSEPPGPGAEGEYATYKELKKLCRRQGHFVFNLYLPSGGGRTTELDMVLIHPSGVYSIECKNYSGDIVGDYGSSMWEAVYKSSSHPLYSPVHQNSGHTRALKAAIPKDIPVYSVIVFAGKGNIYTKGSPPPGTFAAKIGELGSVLSANLSTPRISRKNMSAVYAGLKFANGSVTEEMKKSHIRDVKKIKTER